MKKNRITVIYLKCYIWIINPHLMQHRIGIHSGLAIHGNVGGHRRKDYTLIGDSGVNLEFVGKCVEREIRR